MLREAQMAAYGGKRSFAAIEIYSHKVEGSGQLFRSNPAKIARQNELLITAPSQYVSTLKTFSSHDLEPYSCENRKYQISNGCGSGFFPRGLGWFPRGRRLDKVSTLTLPHHGAAGDFNQKLLTAMKPSFCPVAADAVKYWQHPAASVTRSVASEGAMLLVVNANEAALVREHVWTGTS
jgi:hypothetical protein